MTSVCARPAIKTLVWCVEVGEKTRKTRKTRCARRLTRLVHAVFARGQLDGIGGKKGSPADAMRTFRGACEMQQGAGCCFAADLLMQVHTAGLTRFLVAAGPVRGLHMRGGRVTCTSRRGWGAACWCSRSVALVYCSLRLARLLLAPSRLVTACGWGCAQEMVPGGQAEAATLYYDGCRCCAPSCNAAWCLKPGWLSGLLCNGRAMAVCKVCTVCKCRAMPCRCLEH